MRGDPAALLRLPLDMREGAVVPAVRTGNIDALTKISLMEADTSLVVPGISIVSIFSRAASAWESDGSASWIHLSW